MKPNFVIIASYMLLQMRFAVSKYVLLNLNSTTCSPLNAYTVTTVTNVATFSTNSIGIAGY
jgi:hypothetical protein